MIINKGVIVADDTIDTLQNRMRGESLVTVEFLQNIDNQRLTKILNVKSVKVLGANRYQLSSDMNKDIRPDVFRFAVDNQLTLMEMRKEVYTVEDVFQELTK